MSDTAAPTPKKSKKLVIVAALVALLGAGGAGAAWFVMGKPHKDGEQHSEEKKPKKALYSTLDPFTVNLQDPRGERFAQIGISLQYEDPEFDVQLKDKMPAVRNAILILISSKQIEELLTSEGKQKLAQEIRFQTAKSMGYAVADPATARKEAEEEARREKERAEKKAATKAAAAEKDGETDEAEAEPEPPRRKKRTVENPVREVLFSQFIVQ